mmetsp:Transcript_17740/g.53387  ORF Transcript_17740/g.53387 Transcript_17740/m.53387 type:complete len:263 (-) Transcript_17740:366-1154(-)
MGGVAALSPEHVLHTACASDMGRRFGTACSAGAGGTRPLGRRLGRAQPRRQPLRDLLQGGRGIVEGCTLLLHPVHRPETADEVGVVDVDVGELYMDQVRDHLARGLDAALRQSMGDLENTLPEPWEALHLIDLCHDGQRLQLFVDHLHALQAGVLELLDLPLHQRLEGDLRDEELRLWPRRVAHRNPHLEVGEPAEGVEVQHGLREDLVEDEVEPRAAHEPVRRRLLLTVRQATLERVREVPRVPRDHVEQEGSRAHLRLQP